MKFYLSIIVAVYSFNIYAQENYTLSGTVITSNNISLDDYGALLLNDSCAFHIIDGSGRIIISDVCKWSFGVKEFFGGGYHNNGVAGGISADYGIRIHKLGFDNLQVSHPQYRTYTIENDSSTYYQGKVTFEGEYQGEKMKLDKVFYINVLPSLPKLKVLDVTWSNYSEQWGGIYDDGYMTLQINSSRATSIACYEEEDNSSVVIETYFKPTIDEEKGIGLLQFRYADHYFTFRACNFSGCADSKDTLWISVATSFLDIKEYDVLFYPNPVKDVLCVQGTATGIFPLSIYNAMGRLVKYIGVPVTTVDVSSLPNGVYFIQYRNMKDKNRSSFKMIKE